ncbi:MAG: hypothetical protein NC489_32695, partial [Ruminococcus flavefaciens]|nr:hypothetical protein [Ruminococcus flavefaciens]
AIFNGRIESTNEHGRKPFAEVQSALEELIESFPEATEEIEFFRSEFEKFGINTSFDVPELESSGIKKAQTQLDGYRVHLEQAIKQKKQLEELGAIDTDSYKSAIADIEKYSKLIDNIKVEINTNNVKAKIKELEQEFANAGKGFTFEGNTEQLENTIAKLEKDLENLFAKRNRKIDLGEVDTKPFRAIIHDIQEVRNKLDILESSRPDALRQTFEENAEKLKEAKALADDFQRKLRELKIPEIKTNNLKKLESELAKVEAEIDKVYTKWQNDVTMGRITANFDDKGTRDALEKSVLLEKRMVALKAKIAEVSGEAEKTAAEAASAFQSKLGNLKIPEIRTNSLKQLERDLKKAEAELDKLRTNLQNDITMGRITADFSDAGYQKATESITKAEMKVAAIKEKMKTANDTAGKTKGYDSLKSVMTSISSIGNKLSARLKSLTSSIRKFASSALKSFNSGVKNLNDRLAKMSKSITGAIKANDKMNFSMKDAVKTVLKYAFGIRSLFVLMNKLRSATKEGFGNLVQYSGDVNHSVSIMASALLSLKNAFAVAFAPIVNVVAPYITKFIDMMTRAANVVGQFFSALTGKKIAVQATKVYKDYAASLGGVADAAKDADKAMHTLGIDELNIINEDKDKSDNGGVDIGDMFTEVPIENDIADWAKRLRDAFLAQDWEGLGKELAELVNSGLQKIYDFIKDITPKVEQALKNFAKVFNSFVEYLDWDLLGRTIGAGVNLITKSINALLGDEGIDFENLGRKLSVGFRSMIDEIEWTELGNAIGNWFMVAWRIADGFIEDMWRVSADTMKNGWEELGIAVGTAVNGVFDRINFEQIARVITEGFRGVLDAAANALNAIHFDVIAEKINKGLQVLANNTAWEHIGEQVTKFAGAVSKAFNDLLGLDFGLVGQTIGNGITMIVRAFNQLTGEGGIDFERLGTNISNGLRNLFNNIPWEELGNALGNGFMVGWRILDGFITDMSQKNDAGLSGWAQLGISIGNAVNGIFEKIDFAKIGDILARGFNGLVEIIKNWTSTIRWEDIATNISNGIMTFVNGINWKEAGETLSNLVTELLGVFQKVANDTDWKAIGQSIGVFLSSIEWSTIFGQVFDSITTILGGLIDGLKETSVGKIVLSVLAMVAGFKGLDAILPVINTLFGDNGSIISTLKPVLGEGGTLMSIVSTVFGAKGKLVALIGVGIAAVGTVLAVGGKDLVDACFEFVNGILDKIQEAINNIDWAEVWHNLIAAIGAVFSHSMEINGKLISIAIDLVTRLVAGLIEYVVSGQVLKDLAEFGLDLIEGIIKGVVDVIESLVKIPQIIWDAIVNGLKTLFGIHSPSTVMAELGGFMMQGLIDGITSLVGGITDIWNNIKTTAVKIWNNIGDTLRKKWDEIRNKASNIFSDLKNTISDIWDGVQEKASDIWSNVTSYITDKWESLKTSATEKFSSIKDTISEAWSTVHDKIKNIWDTASKYLSDTWESIKKTAGEKFTDAREKIFDVWDKINSKTSEIWGNISQKLGNTWETIQKSAKEKFESVREKIGDVWDKVTTHTTDTWQSISSHLSTKIPEIIGDVKEKFFELPGFMQENGNSTIKGLISGIGEMAGSLRDKVKEMAGNVSAWFKERLDIHSPSGVFKDIAGDTFQGFINGANDKQSPIKDKMGEIAQSAIDSFDGIDREFTTIGENMIMSLDESVYAQRNIVSAQMDSMVSMIKSFFNGFRDYFYQTGENITEGLIVGLNGSLWRLRDKVMEAASNVSGWFRERLGIHSPSTVFAEIGEYTMQGYENGLESGEGGILSQMKSIANDSIKSLSGIGAEIAKTIRAGIYSVPYSDIISGVMDLLMGSLYNSFGELKTVIAKRMIEVVELIKNAFYAVDFSSIGKAMVDGMKAPLESQKAMVYKQIEFMKSTFNGLGDYFFQAGKDIMNGLATGIEEGFSDRVEKVLLSIKQTLSNTLMEVSNFPTPSFSRYNMPAYASGGIVTQPTIALIGEAGPEAIVPLKGNAYS